MVANELTDAVWAVSAADFPHEGSLGERARFLLRYAILAPSSHNSQPWRFAVDGDTVSVHADESRWLESADPDKRELDISLGCAVENLCVAAEHFGVGTEVTYPAAEDHETPITVHLDASGGTLPREAALFDELTARTTNHHPFTDAAIPTDVRDRLRESIHETDVRLAFVTAADPKAGVAELQARADEALMADPDYRRELGHWVGIGALGQSWLLARIGQVAITHFDLGRREGQKNSQLIDHAPAIAVFSTPDDSRRARIRVGQAFERVALMATVEGIAVHPMSQTLERPEWRSELADALDLSGKPQHLVRLGYPTNTDEHPPRWPLEAVLAEPS